MDPQLIRIHAWKTQVKHAKRQTIERETREQVPGDSETKAKTNDMFALCFYIHCKVSSGGRMDCIQR